MTEGHLNRRELLHAGAALVLVAHAGCTRPFDEAAFRTLSETLTGHAELVADAVLTWFDVLCLRFGKEQLAALAAAVGDALTPEEAATRVPQELATVAEALVLAWYAGSLKLPDGRTISRPDATLAWACVPYTHRAGLPYGSWADRPTS